MHVGLSSLLPLISIFVVAILFARTARANQKNLAAPQLPDTASAESAWTAPSEITDRPIPRPVIFSSSFKIVLTMLCLVQVIVLASGVAQYRRLDASITSLHALQGQGVHANGKILDIREQWNRKTRLTLATYTFQVDGREYRRVATLDRFSGHSLRVGQEVDLTYLATDPNVSRLSVERSPQLPLFALLPPILVSTLITLFLIFPILRQRRILSEGVAAPGKVTRSMPVKGGYRLTYTFVDDAGVSRKGTSPYRISMAPGSVVTVLYLPRDPSKSTLYPSQNLLIVGAGTTRL